jgi:regulator of protease activity HflC (stomatin/prohibitin superfamily)
MAKFRQRIQDNNEAIKQRLRIVLDMMKGARPADNVEAIRLLEEVRNLVEGNNDLLDLG